MSWLKTLADWGGKAYSFGKKNINMFKGLGSKASAYLKSDTARNLMGGIDAIAKLSGSKFNIGDYHKKATNLLDTGNKYLGRADNILDNVKGAFKQRKEDSMERKKKAPRKEEDYMEDKPLISHPKFKNRANDSYDGAGRGMFRLFEQ